MTSEYLERPVLSLAERREELKQELENAETLLRLSEEFNPPDVQDRFRARVAALVQRLDNLTEE